MSMDVSETFRKQFEREVHDTYQRQGSLLRGTVRTKNSVRGASTTFQKVGKGEASQKTRNGTITPMNLEHTPVECVLADYYAGDWVDKFDELKMEHSEREVVINAGAWGLGRKTDELILAAAAASPNTGPGSGLISKARILEALERLNDKDVPNDGKRYALVTPHQWSEMLNAITEFASSEFVGGTPFVNGYEARKWLGAIWMQHTGLPGRGTSGASCLLWHKNAIGHAIGSEVQSDITWHGDRAAHFVVNAMSQGACLIDPDGVVALTVDDTASLS